MKLSIASIVVATLALSQLAFAEPDKTSKTTITNIEMCIPDSRTEFVAFVAREAVDMGYFQKRGLNVTFTEVARKGGAKYRATGMLNKGILDNGVATGVGGREDCVFGSSTVERFLLDKEPGIKPLMVSYYGENYDTHLVVAKNSKIKSVKELSGKKLHIGQLPTRISVERLLAANGVPLKSMDLTVGLDGGAERLTALETGEIAAMTAYLPSMSYLLATDKVRILSANVVSRYLSPHVPHGLLIVHEAFAKTNPKVTEDMLAAMNEAYEHILRNPAEILNVLLRHSEARGGDSWYNMTPAEVQKAANFVGKVKLVTVGKDPTVDAQLNCDVQNFAKEIKKSGHIKEPNDLGDWFGVAADKRNCPAKGGKQVASR